MSDNKIQPIMVTNKIKVRKPSSCPKGLKKQYAKVKTRCGTTE
jgi:hypothetical protein